MTIYLEVWRPEGAELVTLEHGPIAIGRGKGNDVVLGPDDQVSRLHAVLEQVRWGWCIRDLSSRNGTFVNGDRVDRDRPLHAGDEIHIGRTRLVFRADRSDDGLTAAPVRAPDVTPREREVLLALFRPALDAGVFNEPATTREIAAELAVSEAAIKQHLAKLYDKFAIGPEVERKRVLLANEALRRGAITLADVRAQRR